MSEKPFTRREALALAAGSLAAATCGPGRSEAGSGEEPALTAWIKDPGPFVRHATNLESRLEDMEGLLTPNHLFFVRNHAPTPVIEPSGYALSVRGPGIEREISLSLDQLRQLPSHTVVAYLECAGNWRGFFQAVTGRAATGSQWGTGAVGCAEWTGPRLRDVLELAGIRPGAVDVNVIGLDEGAWERPMPLEKARHPDTLLALSMNGDPLPPDHGFPVRAVLPGWVGSSSVKWVGALEVSTEKVWVSSNTTSYVLVGEDWPADAYAPADGAPITTGRVKSALALPRQARVQAGPVRLRGFAYSPNGPIQRVEWSEDAGQSWSDARLIEPLLPWAWSRFEVSWEATAGERHILTRATDAAGQRQPLDAVHNEKGYLLNVALSHPITVS